MPPLVPGKTLRQYQALANPANQAKATSQQQQGGSSGTIPGTTSDPQQVAVATGLIQTYPATDPSPHGDQVAGVGITVLNNDGNPVVVLGNLAATQTSAVDLPANFQDGGFAFVDAAGDLVAGYSQETGLWGFGGAAAAPLMLTAWMDWTTDVNMSVRTATGGSPAGYGITVPAVKSGATGYFANACVTQVGYSPAQTIGFWGDGGSTMPGWTSDFLAIVSAYTLDGVSSIGMTATGVGGPYGHSYQMADWTVDASTGVLLSVSGNYLNVASSCMLAVNYLLSPRSID